MELEANRVVVRLEQVTNTCFVAMPFHSLFETEYQRVIRPAVEEAGLACVRGDEIYAAQPIVQNIWQALRSSRVVVAELSDRNPNVMYEVGLAHAIGKPIVFLTRSETDVPFDLRALKYLYYDPTNPFWGTDLRSELTKTLQALLASSEGPPYLAGLTVEARLPSAPMKPLSRETATNGHVNLSGVWGASWVTLKARREHQGVLVIPTNHGDTFTASITVSYLRDGEQTIVQESLAASVQGPVLALTGVGYTYLQQGKSSSYHLDSFELQLSESRLSGTVRLRHGVVKVSFARSPGP
jgi:hypothetical protein